MCFCSKLSISALASVLLFYSVCFAAPAQKESSDPKILWAFGAIRASSNPPKVEAVRSGMVLSSGDKLKMMVQIMRKCFVYLIHKDTQGNLTMLFPYSLKQFDADYQVARKYYSPKGESWFQLDGRTGTETFYFIASDQRLLDIEYTYGKYTSSEPSWKFELAELILSELDLLSEQYPASHPKEEMLAENRSNQRGFERATGADPADITGLAREISFNNIYSETFIIEHRDAGVDGMQDKK